MEFRKSYKIGWNVENEKEVKEKGLEYYGFNENEVYNI